MWFHNNHFSLYWIENKLYSWLIMVRILNKPDTLLEEFIYKEMVKSAICTRHCGVMEVCNWQTLETRMLGKTN